MIGDTIPYLPFPFPDGAFPENLGAVVQPSVLDGSVPARAVVHAADNSWSVADGATDLNQPGAIAPIREAVDWNASVAGLASLPVGHVATRCGPGEPWTVGAYDPPAAEDGDLSRWWGYLLGLVALVGVLLVIVFALIRR